MAAALPASHSQVRVNFSCFDLPSKDLLSKSDPFLVLYSKNPNNSFTRVMTTECIRNNENPKFTTGLTLDYFFETIQEFRVEVYDCDSDSDPQFKDLSIHDKIGHVDFQLANVVGGYNSTFDKVITKPDGHLRTKGRVQIRADQLTQSRLKAYCSFRCQDLKRGTYLGSKDETILELVHIRPDNSQMVIYKSEMIWDSQDPKYADFKVCLGALVNGDVNKPLIVRIIRWKNASKQEVLGEVQLTPAQLQKQLPDPAKKFELLEQGTGKKRGTLIVDKFVIQEEASFIDYLKAGLDFSLTVAIDFTGSNGDPTSPQSLHFLDPTGKIRNQYIDSLRSVGNVVAAYCGKQLLPALGFGGFASIDGKQPDTSHCFPLSLSSQYPFCDGIEGIVQCYCNNLPRIQLSGPTYFEQLILSAQQTAMRPYTPEYQHYNILLILTDGVLNDLDKTIDALCSASDKPLSVIIIGVGNADFTIMEKLDGDEQRITSRTFGPAKRDIVQFVPYNKFASNIAELSRTTLAEIPEQVLNFMNLHSIKPAVRAPPPAFVYQEQPPAQQQGAPPAPAPHPQ